jgi:phage-related tail fiber protein
MARKVLNGLNLSSQKIIGLADGSAADDAATFGQVQAAIRGLVWHPEARAATTAAITLSGTQTIDGVAVVAGDRVLVKDQASGPTNGIYVVAAGAWTRATDLDEASEFSNGVAVTVEAGTVNGDRAFVMTTDGAIVVGTTALAFAALGGSGTTYTAGAGLALSGSAFSVVAGAGIIADGTSTRIDPTYSGLGKRFAVNVPSGSTTATITHNLGTLDVGISVYEIATGDKVFPDERAATTNTVVLTFAVAPTTGQYRCVVLA